MNSLTYTLPVWLSCCLKVHPCVCFPFCCVVAKHLVNWYLSFANILKRIPKTLKCCSTAFYSLYPTHMDIFSLTKVLVTSVSSSCVLLMTWSAGQVRDEPGQPMVLVLVCCWPLFPGERSSIIFLSILSRGSALSSLQNLVFISLQEFLTLENSTSVTSPWKLYGQMHKASLLGKMLLHLPAGKVHAPGPAGIALPDPPVLLGLPNAWSYAKASSVWSQQKMLGAAGASQMVGQAEHEGTPSSSTSQRRLVLQTR